MTKQDRQWGYRLPERPLLIACRPAFDSQDNNEKLISFPLSKSIWAISKFPGPIITWEL